MTGRPPLLRIRQAPLTADDKTPRVRISISAVRRDLPTADARAVADKIHDLCDRLEQSSPDHRPHE